MKNNPESQINERERIAHNVMAYVGGKAETIEDFLAIADLIIAERRPLPADGLRALDVDKVAQEIRTFDGNHDKGAGEIAEHLCAKFGTPQRTELNEHDLIQYLSGWGINQAAKLGKAICGHFVLPPAKVVSVKDLSDLILNHGNKPRLATAIHQLIYGAKP